MKSSYPYLFRVLRSEPSNTRLFWTVIYKQLWLTIRIPLSLLKLGFPFFSKYPKVHSFNILLDGLYNHVNSTKKLQPHQHQQQRLQQRLIRQNQPQQESIQKKCLAKWKKVQNLIAQRLASSDKLRELCRGTAAPRWVWVPRCVIPQQILRLATMP